MSESKAIFLIDILKNTISVYFDTFFVFYFFKVVDYEVLPLAKYYFTMYLFIGIGFLIIRKAIKNNIKVPYLRIGISLQAIYIALIMLLKEDISNYIILVSILKGIADGFYWYPKNILKTEKINNENRQKINGLTSTIKKIISIIVPLILGVALTFMSYTDLGKIFFALFIVMFIISFYLKDKDYNDRKFDLKDFFKLIKKNKDIRKSLLIPFFSGFTYSSGVMGLIITLYKINNFKTNLNLGIADSLCSFIALLVCILYTSKIKKSSFKLVVYVSGIISFLVLMTFSFVPTITVLIIYLFVRNSLVVAVNLISDNISTNLTNCDELKNDYKPEYFLIREIMFSVARTLGYAILFVVALVWGMDYISYILVIPAVSILIEAIIVGKLSKQKIAD